MSSSRVLAVVPFFLAAISANPLAYAHHNTSELQVTGGPVCTPVTSLVGNGSPMQNRYNVQLSDNFQCNGASCTAGASQSYDVSWSVNGGTNFAWISGGFSVGQSTSTGDSYSCTAGQGQTGCIYKSTGYTSYTVVKTPYTSNDCGGPSSNPATMYSPNTDGTGTFYFCEVDSNLCQYKGYSYWNYNINSGAP